MMAFRLGSWAYSVVLASTIPTKWGPYACYGLFRYADVAVIIGISAAIAGYLSRPERRRHCLKVPFAKSSVRRSPKTGR